MERLKRIWALLLRRSSSNYVYLGMLGSSCHDRPLRGWPVLYIRYGVMGSFGVSGRD